MVYSGDVPLSQLQAQLEAAVEEEDYEKAAALRDVLQRRRFDVRLAVEEANERFYAAFQSGSLAAMSEVWGSGEHVQCIHPLSGCVAGRKAVIYSWKAILGSGRLRITLEDVRVYAADGHGFVTCVELTESSEGKGRIAATNVFELQGGAWKMVHHHGGPTPRAMPRIITTGI
ncbi:F-box SKIP8 [Micractinium conductrix]|uniref:F-box SKIP8 n=1 Tax=Micractinium conductrix TaxID=554055 RepID=A0A2P6V3G9_9CHLO|nr:F-box SKIP8 [Micractinium conductrix]|eukprot:PSC68639.1 F-box SKIP8 [Micractinium conductrix]